MAALWLVRFHVYEHSLHSLLCATNGGLHCTTPLMRIMQRHVRIGLHMNVDVINHSRLTHSELLHSANMRNSFSSSANRPDNLTPRHAIHQIMQRRPNEKHSVVGNDRRRYEGRPVVC